MVRRTKIILECRLNHILRDTSERVYLINCTVFVFGVLGDNMFLARLVTEGYSG